MSENALNFEFVWKSLNIEKKIESLKNPNWLFFNTHNSQWTVPRFSTRENYCLGCNVTENFKGKNKKGKEGNNST
jgi:hypothetical protein